MGTSQLGQQLSDDEVRIITAFLGTLTGQPPRVEHPILPLRTKTTPRPQ
jgi:cytochrome c peroxidase